MSDPLKALHLCVMRAIAESLSDTTLVLKGGTALLLAYGLDRFSEDLDFDSPKKIALENRIKDALSGIATLEQFSLLKDTNTVTRARIVYKDQSGLTGRLKIEVSHRENAIPADEVTHRSNIQVATIGRLIRQKLAAAVSGDNPRTAGRDLFDILFLCKHHSDSFSEADRNALKQLICDPQKTCDRYKPAFQVDALLADQSVDNIVLEIIDAAETAWPDH